MRNSKKGHTTIIKRSSRKSHDAFHGGAWKVAFADFTLAMMALFMVLWIMGAVTEEERKEIVSLLNGESIFEGNTLTPVTQKEGNGGEISLFDTRHARKKDRPETQAKKEVTPAVQSEKTESLEEVNARSKSEIEDLARIIMKITSAYDAQANLKMEIVPQGLRILITDDRKREMFQRSSAILTPFFKRLLTEFAPELNKINNKIIITGHTDATRFRDQVLYNNWNLSGERAMQARSVLTRSGLDPNKVLQVSGMADQMLLDPEHPLSSANRRIEIMVLTHSASDSLYQFFGQHGEKVIKPLTEKLTQDH
ncbi:MULTISPECIES: putative lateral flagellar export/assembly protein LafU [Enterobacter cloacae complex]|uniref:Putative lateral flagellar export/assembly protein LafU n=1 Tax=Enterobacter cloacae TaxID=550 RepID=A0A7H8UBS2_ENTCL|nr:MULTISPECIES: putative lateral flagellar export/assembly protein LafU [Enterobacter cloacae complex]MDE4081016.1 putative lateral flagellar export/assembly protein LafU [Enterobacter pasteurii]QKZ96954.1 putative lateral flagellar export/assembly protein LafU [Enterobacter cloacae]QLA68402.1 putative lateral flagellar export/assembly protein LafU [Enterobacter pasteurii]HAS1786282.1 putative lateral flagellar export/assembly protein LafU [Enterobacter pasteurii]